MAARFVEAAGVRLAVEEEGVGPPVLLVHGAGTDRTLWRETVSALGDGLRTLAYDRRGYGESEAPAPYTATSVPEQAEDAVAVLDASGAEPALVCGHEFGALVALDLLHRHPDLVRAAVLVEPPLLWLSPAGPQLVGELREAIEVGARAEGPGGAVESFLLEVAGPAVLDRLGRRRLERARGAARALAADLVAAPAWGLSRRELRAIAAPTAVVAGTDSPAVRRHVARNAAKMLGAARLQEVDAGHLVPLDAPAAVARAIEEMAAAAS